jgi:hypothetical protein
MKRGRKGNWRGVRVDVAEVFTRSALRDGLRRARRGEGRRRVRIVGRSGWMDVIVRVD